MELTDKNIILISDFLLRQGIREGDLFDSLLDHYCCLVEKHMNNQSFEDAFKVASKEFTPLELKTVQSETQYLLTLTKFKKMKTTLRYSGIFSAILIVTGTFFKIMHWPGANIMFVLGMFLMAILFLPLFFILKHKNSAEENRNIILSISGAVIGILTTVGIWFKMLHWPGATVILLSAISLLLLAYLPLYIFSVYRKSLQSINAFGSVILIIAAGSTLLLTVGGTGTSRIMGESITQLIKQKEKLVADQIKINEAIVSRSAQNAKFAPIHAQTIQLVKWIQKEREQILLSSNEHTLDYQLIYRWEDRSGVGLTMQDNPEYNFDALKKQLQNWSTSTGISFPHTESRVYHIDQPLNVELQRLSQVQLLVLQEEQKALLH